MNILSGGISKKISNVKTEDIELLELDKDKIYLVSVKLPEDSTVTPEQVRLVGRTAEDVFNRRGLNPIVQIENPYQVQIKVAEVIEKNPLRFFNNRIYKN